MNKKIAILIIVLVVILVFTLFYVTNNSHAGNVVNLNTSKGYTTIQEAIDAKETLDGHTLLVYPGVYHEYVEVTKTLTIEGKNRDETIVEPGNTSVIIVLVQANDSVVANLTVRGSTFGIWCRNVRGCSVLNNRVVNCATGIRLDRSGKNEPALCNCLVKGNEVLNCTLRGIHLYDAFNNTVTDNLIQNTTGGSYAAIDIEYSYNNTFVHNQLKNNECGLWMNTGAFNNTIYYNNFINNTLQVRTYGGHTTWDSGYPSGGNYWSDYVGTDANGDGIGDTWYTIDEENVDRYPLMSPTAFP